jgi:hypothetical protein
MDDLPTHVTAPTIVKSASTRIGFFKTILSTEAVTNSKGLVEPSTLQQCWSTSEILVKTENQL